MKFSEEIQQFILRLRKNRKDFQKAQIDLFLQFFDQRISLFQNVLNKLGLNKLIECLSKLQVLSLSPQQTVFCEGDDSQYLYILFQGSVIVKKLFPDQTTIVKGKHPLIQKLILKLNAPAQFGQHGINNARQKRSATVVTDSNAKMLLLHKNYFNQFYSRINQEKPIRIHNFFVKYLGVSEPVNEFSKLIIVKLKYRHKQKIFTEGQVVQGYYLLKAGQVKLSKQTAKSLSDFVILSQGSRLHDYDLSKGLQIHYFTAVSKEFSSVYFISKEDIKILPYRLGRQACRNLIIPFVNQLYEKRVRLQQSIQTSLHHEETPKIMLEENKFLMNRSLSNFKIQRVSKSSYKNMVDKSANIQLLVDMHQEFAKNISKETINAVFTEPNVRMNVLIRKLQNQKIEKKASLPRMPERRQSCSLRVKSLYINVVSEAQKSISKQVQRKRRERKYIKKQSKHNQFRSHVI